MKSARLADDKTNMLFKVTEKCDEYPQQLQDGILNTWRRDISNEPKESQMMSKCSSTSLLPVE
jgi:hypothetical protein